MNIFHYHIFGFDPGLAHGAMVFCSYMMSPTGYHIQEFQVVFQYNKKSEYRLKMDSPVGDFARFFHHLRSCMIKALGPDRRWLSVQVLADFDQNSVHFHTQKKQVVKLAQFLGYLQRGFHELGTSTGSITPGKIRQWLSLKPSASKDEVHLAFTRYIESQDDEYSKKILSDILEMPNDRTDRDILDSFIIAHFGAWVAYRKKYVGGGKHV